MSWALPSHRSMRQVVLWRHRLRLLASIPHLWFPLGRLPSSLAVLLSLWGCQVRWSSKRIDSFLWRLRAQRLHLISCLSPRVSIQVLQAVQPWPLFHRLQRVSSCIAHDFCCYWIICRVLECQRQLLVWAVLHSLVLKSSMSTLLHAVAPTTTSDDLIEDPGFDTESLKDERSFDVDLTAPDISFWECQALFPRVR